MPLSRKDALVGCLLGTALGDSIGLPFEGMSARRQRRFDAGALRQRLIFGRGMVSDDTEHAGMTAQALIVSAGDPDRFERSLAWRLRWWLIGLPAGVGWATLRALVKLWVGFPPSRSGVRSAGNGPCMRSPLLGVAYGADRDRLRTLVYRSTRLTHRDPRAEQAALIVALAAHVAATSDSADDLPARFRDHLAKLHDGGSTELLNLTDQAMDSVRAGETVETFAGKLGLGRGISGYVLHTVPVVLHAWLSHPRDFRAAVTAVVRCGGDTDTTGAIVGGIVGAAVGKAGLPADWLAGLWEWPASPAWMEVVAARLDEALERGEPRRAVRLPLVALGVRKVLFAGVVLGHGFRRLLPPY